MDMVTLTGLLGSISDFFYKVQDFYNTELAIFALGQVHCSTPILVPKLGFVKILPP
jgi:hypothetical protein